MEALLTAIIKGKAGYAAWALSCRVALRWERFLPEEKKRHWHHYLGRVVRGDGWSVYPASKGWSAINYKQFSGWHWVGFTPR